MKLIYKGSVSKKEKEEYATAIRRNCIEVRRGYLGAACSSELFNTVHETLTHHYISSSMNLQSMQTIIEAMQTLDIVFKDPELTAVSEKYSNLDTDATLTEEMSYEIDRMWKDEGLQECYARRDEYWCLDAAVYYFENVIRLGEEDFVPSDEDMIMTRVRTTGIVVTEFEEVREVVVAAAAVRRL